MNEIPKIIHLAIERMEICFGGTEIKLISEEMYRLPPDEFSPVGKLGVDISIMGIKTFLGCESMAELICQPMGMMIAEEFVFNIIKNHPMSNKQ